MRRLLAHGRPIRLRRIPRPHQNANLRNARIERANLRQRSLQVLLHIIRQRPQRRNIQHVHLIFQPGALPRQRIDGRQIPRDRLPRPRRR